jgi:Chlorophyll A-B binding protein
MRYCDVMLLFLAVIAAGFIGDYSFDPFNLWPSDPEEQNSLRTKEVKNGRLAMVSTITYMSCNYSVHA